MAKLGRREREFCKKYQIPECRLFDASGLTRAQYKQIMKVEEKWAAFGVTPCGIEEHMLRNRHGTCLMCDTKRLAWLFSSKMSGYLYVASGAGGDLMKLGFSNNPTNRLKIANYEGWGGHRDWCLRAFGWASEAGQLESRLHARFAHTRVPLEWDRNWRLETTKESFQADLTEAIHQLVLLCDEVPEIVPPPWH